VSVEVVLVAGTTVTVQIDTRSMTRRTESGSPTSNGSFCVQSNLGCGY